VQSLYGEWLGNDRSKHRPHLVSDHLRMTGAVQNSKCGSEQNSKCGSEGLRAPGEFETVHARQLHVSDEHVHGMSVIKHGQCFATVSGRRNLATETRQEFGGYGEQEQVIID